MGILDKAKAAVTGETDLATAFKEQDKVRSHLAELSQHRATLERELRDASGPLGELSLATTADGRKKYDVALATVERIERDIRHNKDAQEATRAKFQSIAQRIAELTHAERIRTFVRLGKARQQKADALQLTLVAFADQYQTFRNDTEKLIHAFPEATGDIGLGLGSLSDAVAVELYRLWPVGPGQRNAASAVPGAHSGLGLDAPSNIAALSDVVRQQHEAALDRFKASVTPREAAPPLAVADSPDVRVDAVPMPAPGKPVSADDVMGNVKDVSLPVIDHRKGARSHG